MHYTLEHLTYRKRSIQDNKHIAVSQFKLFVWFPNFLTDSTETNHVHGWKTIYDNSPRAMIENFNLIYNKDQILGGGAALWAEQVSLVNRFDWNYYSK